MTANSPGKILFAILLLALTACAGTATSPVPEKFCSNSNMLIDAHFDGGNFHKCAFDTPAKVSMDIRPEDVRINPSPWFAFRVSAREPTAIQLTLDFADDQARYWPKLSYDGYHWLPMPETAVSTAEGEHTMTLSLPAHSPVIWVAAQELITAGWYEQWLRELDAGDDVNVRLFGSSVQGRPLYVAETAARPEFVVLLGRQHPPEVTGALAMRPFVQALMGGTALARSFRERYQVIIAPLMNPDGVALGHWRHNVNGVDLNRDWGSFTQAETAAFAAELQKLEATGARAAFMLDFHSTKRSLFYTQLASDFPGDEDFATTWLERSRKRMPDYEFSHEARARSGQGNSKNWYFGNYGIPAITYEIGDEVARDDIARSSSIFAEEFMRLMLDAPPPY